MERKSFQDLPGEDNPHFLTEGIEIYKLLKSRYPNIDDKSLDSILNILCCSLVCLITDNVPKDNQRVMIQIIHKILTRNLG